ncbi:hypothetical protein ACFFJN_19080 [Erwinia mallotivora]|uniref:hypothetical protein n=1 Tax=Erwinia mallotivora TaxID=69222 RepID=UPI0035E8D41A
MSNLSALKTFAVATVTFIGLQGMAFADASQTASVKAPQNVVQQSKNSALTGGADATEIKVAARLRGGSRLNTACDDTGLPCPSDSNS